jgi:TRAP-type C4-dicarboxylate transport system substrate-binding protein
MDMTMMSKLIVSLFLMTLMASPLQAKKIKVGVLAPEGTNWATQMKKMGKEVKKATKGEVSFKFYFGGAQGDEVDVLRKIRINQLQGGVFTGKTLGDIVGDIRVVEIPYTFAGDEKKAWATVEKLAPYFNQQLEAKNFINLGFFEIGMVYFVSQKKSASLDSLKGIKIWSWEGDQIVNTMIQKMNLISVPLALPDVLSSLSTGIIEAAYAPPMGMIALQWNTKIKYLVDFPIAYSVGSFLISKKAWAKIPQTFHKSIKDIAAKYMVSINNVNRKDNIDSLTAIKSSGVEFLSFPEKDIQKAQGLRSEIIKSLRSKLFSPTALKKLEQAL